MAFISNGTTILDAGAFDVSLGGLEFISESTASASASISFTSGIDSTYDVYQFEFINMHPASNDVRFQFNLSTDGGSNYNVTKTSTYFIAYGDEGGSDVGLGYSVGEDLAQGTGFQTLAQGIGNGADESTSGTLQIFNPSSTTYVKHFIGRLSNYENANRILNCFSAGYGNTTSAVNAIQFKVSSGNFDGTIKMYGIKGS